MAIKIGKENLILTKHTPISKEYILGKTLGTGAFGQVRMAVHKATKQTRAVKVLKKADQDLDALIEEVSIVSKLSHPSIMAVYEIFDDKLNLYIVTEYCKGGELFDEISKRGNFTEADTAFIMKQILSGIAYSHQNRIVHRDLKPENILLENKSGKDNELTVKIIDWGCAKTIKKDEKLSMADGTPYYIAPEVLTGEYDEKCDVWSLGVIMYILLCGYPPFNGSTDDEIYDAIQAGNFEFPAAEWKDVSKEAKDLLKRMLTVDPNQRLSAIEAVGSPWIQKYAQMESKNDKKLTKNICANMKRFKQGRALEQATISYIVNQLVSKDERKSLLKQFQEWDTNGDGVLSRDEIINGYRKTYGKVDENEIDNMFKSIDLDGNGTIDYNEFLSCTINKDKILSKQNLEMCFKAFDTDGSGSLDINELMAIFTKGDSNQEDKKIFENMIKSVDLDGNGEISMSEFKIIMQKFFS